MTQPILSQYSGDTQTSRWLIALLVVHIGAAFLHLLKQIDGACGLVVEYKMCDRQFYWLSKDHP